MENKNENSRERPELERILNKLPPEIQEKVSEMAGLAGTGIGESSKISSFETWRNDRFNWIGYIFLLIGPWAFLIWMGINVNMAIAASAATVWSGYVIRAWISWYEMRQKLRAKVYGEVEDDKGKEE